MAVSPELRDHVLELLAPLGPVLAKPMFGGLGIYLGGLIFAILTRHDVLYLRSDAESRAAFEAAGAEPFRPRPGLTMPYHEAPPDALEDAEGMREWAETAIAAARRAEKAKKGRARRARDR